MRLPRALPLILALIALTLGLAAPLSPASADPQADQTAPQADAEHAEDVLQYAEGLLAPKSAEDAADQIEGQEVGGLGGGPDTTGGVATSVPDPTLALRDLYFAKESLSGTDRRQAERLLARPAANKVSCASGPPVCVHYSTSGSNKATWRWVKETRATVQSVFRKYTAAGYRRPARDGNKYVDIYLSDIASQGIYGYCQTANGSYGGDSTSAFCVLDNDYAKSQYPGKTPKQNLRVTAAHEFFHAIQFGYDALEDVWLMESTATWAEEELYPWINDNRQYLPYGQLGNPGKPLDAPGSAGIYGNWLFFQFLGQKAPASQAGLPTVVRDIWRRADSTKGRAADRHSVQAVDQVLKARGKSFDRLYGLFAATNQHARKSYPDGSAYRPTRHGTQKVWRASTGRSGSWSSQHLTSNTIRFVPKNTPAGRKASFAITVPAGSQTYGFVTLYLRSGAIKKVQLQPGAAGRASATVEFGSNRVSYVDLVMANSGRKYRCGEGIYSCSGKPLSNGVAFAWRGTFR